MILNPNILALLVSSLLISLMTIYAACYGIKILRFWDISSGSELQLSLERRTYLISTIVSYFLVFQLVSLFLFILTADSICNLFVGAMCAVGTLTADRFGYPTLLLKVMTFILAGLWLIMNHVDNQACDYPLIRSKYRLLLLMAPLVLAETLVQGSYFLRLKPNIITSCCGSLFSQSSQGISADITALPPVPMLVLFCFVTGVTLAAGVRYFLSGKGSYFFAGMSGLNFMVSIASIISSISLYIYELPSHHCPFCILQHEYGYIGYALYLLIFIQTITGLGVGLLHMFRNKPSLEKIIQKAGKKLALISVISLALFMATVTVKILCSHLTVLNSG